MFFSSSISGVFRTGDCMPPPTVHLTCFCFSPFFFFFFFQELRHAVLRAQRVSSEARDEAAAVKMEQEEQVRKEKKRKHIYTYPPIACRL